jgi:hypothetical protein
MRHIYVFGPPGSQKTVMIVRANAQKYGTTESSEWITLVHGLLDEMENPFVSPNGLEVITREQFSEKHTLDIRFHVQAVHNQPHPAVEFSLREGRNETHLTLADALILGEVFRQLIQASWVRPFIAGRLAKYPARPA